MFTCRLAFELELLLQRGERGDRVAEEHGLEQAEEAVHEQVGLFRGEHLEPVGTQRAHAALRVTLLLLLGRPLLLGHRQRPF